MKAEARIFEIITAFFFLSALVYGLWSSGEPVGTTALVLVGGLSLIIGTFFRFVARRVPQRPEDNTEAEISDGAGEVGFFSPGSYWPFALAAVIGLAAVALAFFEIWLFVGAAVLVLIMVCGLVFEYHVGPDDAE